MNLEILKQLRKYNRLALGFSGGADSTALALKLVQYKIPFEAVHFHHHLRQKSADQDADFCKDFCEHHDIPFSLVDIPVKDLKQSGESIESAARRLRMEYWEKNFSGSNSAVLLAHHKDDILENFFLRAMRGSSSSGLSGLKEARVINGVNYIRPILQLTKVEIIQYLSEKKVEWREDESNSEDIYSRNIVRNQVIPTIEKMAPIEGLYRTVENVASDAEFIELEAKRWLLENKINCESFKSLHNALKPRVLRNYILTETGIDFIPGHDAIARLGKELSHKHQKNAIIPLGKNIELTISPGGEVFIEPQPYEFEWNWQDEKELILPGKVKLSINYENTACCETFDAKKLATSLTVRNWKNGDRMTPFSHKSKVKVKDLFADRKTPHLQRKKLPLIFSEQDLIWIPTIRRAEFGLIDANTTNVNISYEKL